MVIRKGKLIKLIIQLAVVLAVFFGFIYVLWNFMFAEDLNDIVRYGIWMIAILIISYGNKD
jgi:hypothetical protein